ncbi:hypothetical protein VTJ04DRAFT_10932 [Mycothermus thermophilus]|uniref:uncharacterized protein n=1 Tax=Humicola insolens TaxID=85995 RepID=UPI0037426CA5
MPLRQLFPPLSGDGGCSKAQATEDNALVDTIAVHGEAGKLWLRDDLPARTPNARISLYVYDSTVVYSSDRTSFIDKANFFLAERRAERISDPTRPLILIGHSLGGLLIKQALINAYNNDRYRDIKLATQGLVFFATLHSGSNRSLAALGQIAAKVARSLGMRREESVVQVLEQRTIFADLMQDLWKHRVLDCRILSFWGSRDDIVTKESATFGLPGTHEDVIPLNADHRSICKFGNKQKDRDNLKLVNVNITELYKEAIRQRERGELIALSAVNNDETLQSRFAGLRTS